MIKQDEYIKTPLIFRFSHNVNIIKFINIKNLRMPDSARKTFVGKIKKIMANTEKSAKFKRSI